MPIKKIHDTYLHCDVKVMEVCRDTYFQIRQAIENNKDEDLEDYLFFFRDLDGEPTENRERLNVGNFVLEINPNL